MAEGMSLTLMGHTFGCMQSTVVPFAYLHMLLEKYTHVTKAFSANVFVL